MEESLRQIAVLPIPARLNLLFDFVGRLADGRTGLVDELAPLAEESVFLLAEIDHAKLVFEAKKAINHITEVGWQFDWSLFMVKGNHFLVIIVI